MKYSHQTINSEFKFERIPVKNVAQTLKNLKLSKEMGLDKIPAKTLKTAADVIVPSLTFIFNHSLLSGVFIDEWKRARVTPIFRSDDRQKCEN